MYKDVGISDVRDFYKDKFAFKTDFDFTKRALYSYHIDIFKRLWMFSNIKPNSKVLDFGCGSGVLSSLKRKGCEITGIDFSETALEYAKKINNYDYVHSVDIFDYDNFGYFDYIVSIDVFGHIPFEEKDKVIERLKRFLKPGGTMLHGIECGQIDYAAMSKKELKEFIEVDGHVGIEGKIENINRFKNEFKFVSGEVRFDIVNSVNEYVKQYDAYGDLAWGEELILYLKSLNEKETFAFNIASGVTQIVIENKNMSSSDDAAGFLFLKASDKELKHQEMEIISSPLPVPTVKESISLIEDNDVFVEGWWNAERNDIRKFRWSKGNSYCRIEEQEGKTFNFMVYSSYPKINKKPVEVFFLDSKKLISSIELKDNKPMQISIPITKDQFDLQIFCDVSWVPNLTESHSYTRELGIGIFNVSIE